jgi:type I restriction enzyme S subunit
MKKGWQTARLGDLIELISGQHIDSKDYNTSGRGVGYLTGPSDFGPIYPVVTKWTEHPKIKAKKNDILITVKGSGVGKVNLMDADEVAISRQLMAIRVVNAERQFVYLLLESVFDHFQEESTGAAIPGISREQVLGLQIPVPPLAEQRRIVGVLDEAFASLATAQAHAAQNLQNARALFESHLNAVFTDKKWKKTALGDLCSRVEYGSSAKSKKEGKIPVLRMGNIQSGRFDWGDLVYSDDGEEIERYMLRHNDVLFNRTNSPELVGKTAIYKGESPAIFAGYLIRIHRMSELLDADYLNYFMNSRIAFDYGKTVVISSVNQANINGAKLKTYPIPTPPLSDQQAIAAQLDALSGETQRLTRIYEQKLAALAALKKSLLHQAFNGEL